MTEEKSLECLSGRGSRSDELQALAARCEREEPSRELDQAIAMALETLPTKPFADVAPFARLDGMYWVFGKKDTPSGAVEEKWSRNPPLYTRSLDAAVTLVPEGAGIELNRYWRREPGQWWSAHLIWGLGTRSEEAEARDIKSAALALCAAALRARAALAGNVQASDTRPKGNTP